MYRILTAAFALSTVLAGSAMAETYEIQMLNRDDARETMVFSPSALRIAPGDTVKFVAADRGHNAESIDGMWPESVEPFAGKINEEVAVTFDQPGFYGVRCKPHFAMGMVMTIAVGEDNVVPDGWLEARLSPRSKKRMAAQLEDLTQ